MILLPNLTQAPLYLSSMDSNSIMISAAQHLGGVVQCVLEVLYGKSDVIDCCNLGQ